MSYYAISVRFIHTDVDGFRKEVEKHRVGSQEVETKDGSVRAVIYKLDEGQLSWLLLKYPFITSVIEVEFDEHGGFQ